MNSRVDVGRTGGKLNGREVRLVSVFWNVLCDVGNEKTERFASKEENKVRSDSSN